MFLAVVVALIATMITKADSFPRRGWYGHVSGIHTRGAAGTGTYHPQSSAPAAGPAAGSAPATATSAAAGPPPANAGSAAHSSPSSSATSKPATTTNGTVVSGSASAAGVTAGVSLKAMSGDSWLQNGQSLSATAVNGDLYITGSNVTVTNVSVKGTIYINYSPSGNMVSPVPSNVTLTHVTGINMYSNGFSALTLNGVNLVGNSGGPCAQLFDYSWNGVYYPASNLVIENSWFHGLLASNSAHLESLHIDGVQGATITNNIFDATAPNTATRANTTAVITLEPQLYGKFNTNINITNNQLIGGGYYMLYMLATGSSSVSGNSFITIPGYTAGVQYPPSAYPSNQLPSGNYPTFAQSGNTQDGKAVTLPG